MNGDIGLPFYATPRESVVVRVIWTCIGITVFAGAAAFVIKAARTAAAFHGVGA